jgi:hypothetical protein
MTYWLCVSLSSPSLGALALVGEALAGGTFAGEDGAGRSRRTIFFCCEGARRCKLLFASPSRIPHSGPSLPALSGSSTTFFPGASNSSSSDSSSSNISAFHLLSLACLARFSATRPMTSGCRATHLAMFLSNISLFFLYRFCQA